MSDRDRLERLIGIAGMLSATLCPLPPIHPPSQTPSLVVFIRHIISEVLQYRPHPWWPYRARRHPWSHRGALLSFSLLGDSGQYTRKNVLFLRWRGER